MSNVAPYAKPRPLGGRGFAQSTWRLVASLQYANRLADAIARVALQPLASDGACSFGALLWGSAMTEHWCESYCLVRSPAGHRP